MCTRNVFLVPIFILVSVFSFAQKDSIKKTTDNTQPIGIAPTACDCKDAIKINVTKAGVYGLTKPPLGFGTVQEITAKGKTDKQAFEEEHNTAWYLLTINFDGEFVFEIAPQDTTNDYDFLLYKYTDSGFCKALQKKQLKPIRSNLSRVNPQEKGITGLMSEAQNEFVGQGINPSHSKSIKVTKGEKYMLVLDNVYPDGKGHTINFNYIKHIDISGTVLDEDKKGVKAKVSLTDNNGMLLKQLTTADDGKYSISTTLKENSDYTLDYSADNNFVAVKTINTTELKKATAITDIHTTLPKLKKGKKYKMNTINFYGNEARLLPSSYSSVEALYGLMKTNKKMTIQIEGHVNGGKDNKEEKKEEQVLSENRAKTVFDYLVNKGIEKERISIVGYGATKMINPKAKTETEGAVNRRVEINVISIE